MTNVLSIAPLNTLSDAPEKNLDLLSADVAL